MPIIAKAEGNANYQTHPEGQHPAICVDVHDVGLVEYNSPEGVKVQHKVDIYWFCGFYKTDPQGNDALDDNGNPVPLFVRQRYTLSVHEKSKLRPHLESWYGKRFTEAQVAKGLDIEKVIGRPCLLVVVHETKGENTYANVSTIVALPKGMEAPAIPEGYVRICDRPPREPARPQVQQVPVSRPQPMPATRNATRTPQPVRQEPEPVTQGRPWDDDDDLPF